MIIGTTASSRPVYDDEAEAQVWADELTWRWMASDGDAGCYARVEFSPAAGGWFVRPRDAEFDSPARRGE